MGESIAGATGVVVRQLMKRNNIKNRSSAVWN